MLRQLFDRIVGWRGEPVQEVPPLKGQNSSAGAVATDWGYLISGYVTNLYCTPLGSQRFEKASREMDDRGLSFGQIRVHGGSAKSVKLSLLGNPKITLWQAEYALETALKEKGLDSQVKVERDIDWGKLEVICLTDDLPGVNWCGYRRGEPFNHREFLIINCWTGGGLSEMTAHSPEATCVLTRVAEILGFPAGPKHYSHESPIRIEDIVVFAVRWEDPKSGCRYLDVLLREAFVKHKVWHGSNLSYKYTENEYSGEVLACRSNNSDWWPKITVNNRPVYATIVKEPTQNMLKAREKFIKESLVVCRYCGKPATREFNYIRVDMGDTAFGGIDYTCDEERCIGKAREVKSVKTTESPYTQDIWP